MNHIIADLTGDCSNRCIGLLEWIGMGCHEVQREAIRCHLLQRKFTGPVAVTPRALESDVLHCRLTDREVRTQPTLPEEGSCHRLSFRPLTPSVTGIVPAPEVQSRDTSTPMPPVISIIRSSGSSSLTLMVKSAPNCLATSKRLTSLAVPVTMMQEAPACLQATV